MDKFDAVLGRLEATVGRDFLLTKDVDVGGFAIDWRRMFPGRPLCVVRPKSTREVAAIVSACRDGGIAIVPQGGNTGLAGGAVPDSSGRQVVLSLNRMNAIRSVDPIGLTLEVEAGCILQLAKDAATAQGRFLPVSFAAEGSATVGGTIGTNAGGINVLRYGMIRNQILGLEVVLADGSIINGLNRPEFAGDPNS